MKLAVKFLFVSLIFSAFTATICSAEVDIDIHGFVSQGYFKSTDNNFFGATEDDGSLEFNEFGVNVSKELMDNMRTGIQILSRDFGSNDDNKVIIDWAFGDYHWKDWAGIRAGKIKTPKGFYNETRDVDILRNSIFLPQSVYPEILRDVDLALTGVGFYGNFNFEVAGNLSYQMIFGTQDLESNESVSQAIQGITAYDTPVTNDSIDVDSKYVFSLVWDTPLSGLRFGCTYDYSELTATAHVTATVPNVFDENDELVSDFDKYQNTVLSVEYTYENLLLAGEYISTVKDFDISLNGGPFAAGESSEDITADGWYVSASYQLTNWFQLGAYYSESYNDRDDRKGDSLTSYGDDISHRAFFKDVCLTTRFIINEYLSFKIEGHSLKGTYGISPLDQVPDSDGNIFSEDKWNLYAAKFTAAF